MRYTYIICVCLFFGIVLTACKKNGSEKQQEEDYSKYYIKAKIEGEWVTFPGATGWITPIQNNESVKTLITYGWTADSLRTFSFVVSADGEGINPGVYHNENFDDDTAAWFDTSYLGLPSNQMWRGGATLNGTKSTYTFTLTSVTDKVIEGHFAGDFAMDLFDPNIRINIPEGEFYLRRVPVE